MTNEKVTVSARQIPYGELSSIPKTVYKYRSWTNKYHQEIISDQIVFMARPTSFEDPLDCKLAKRYDLLTDEEIYFNYYLDCVKKSFCVTKRT